MNVMRRRELWGPGKYESDVIVSGCGKVELYGCEFEPDSGWYCKPKKR